MNLLFLLVGITSSLAADQETPTFKFLSTRSGLNDPRLDIPDIEVTFPDGYKDKLVLEHYNALPLSKNIDPQRLCSYLGHLQYENDAGVAVTGCPDERNLDGKMYITLLSGRSRYQKSFIMDLDGNVEPVQLQRSNPPSLPVDKIFSSRQNIDGTFIDGDEIGNSAVEENAASSETNGVPDVIKVKLQLGTDSAARATIENDLGTTVDNWLAEMFTHVQLHYLHSSFVHKINFEIAETILEHDEVLSVDNDLWTVSDLAIVMNDDDVDLYAWIVDSGSSSGVAFLASACQYGRTGFGGSKVSLTRGPSRFNGIIESAETLAHEIGHNLGISHDFIGDHADQLCRSETDDSQLSCDQCTNYDADLSNYLSAQTENSGECCTGFMDYNDHPEYWSECSVRMFEQHYVSQGWENCLPQDEEIPSEDVCFDINMATPERIANRVSWVIGSCAINQNNCCVNNPATYLENEAYTQTCCLPAGDYEITCRDAYGYGWDLSRYTGYGEAVLTINGTTYCNDFKCDDPNSRTCTEKKDAISIGAISTTCTDGIQNEEETGIDCGGGTCPACATCTDETQNGEETGIDCGGGTCPDCENDDMFYVDDGCHSEGNNPDDFDASFEPKSFLAGVRCCGMENGICDTVGKCPDDYTTYDDAASKCLSVGGRLCTKEELLSDVCCGTGGGCDSWLVWTSTKISE